MKSALRKSEMNGISLPIPAKKTLRRQSTNESDDSSESFSNGEMGDTVSPSPVSFFSRSFSNSHAGQSLNVYSMSPRSTSFMYQYYSTPKGYYQNQVPRVRSKSSSHYCRDEFASSRLRYRNLNRAVSECCATSATTPSPVLSGIPQTLSNDVVHDPRRRAYSESDSNRRGNVNLSRMSALKKLKKKLGRSGSVRKKSEESYCSTTSNNHSVTSISSLEKVEEGRQLSTSTCSSKRNTISDVVTDLSNLSLLHQENETIKPNEVPSERNRSCQERIRTPSTESVFNHDAELIYQRFLEEHTCYDIMPTSCKMVVFDTRLQARKAFHALIANSVRAAPLWDSEIQCYVGMLTVTDFIRVILTTYKMKDQRVESVEEQSILSWRKLLKQDASFSNVRPNDTLLYSLNVLRNENLHGVPILDEKSGDIFHIINHKRILRFLSLFMNELPKPGFMNRTLGDLKIGRFDGIATVTKYDAILDVLKLLIDKQLSAVPVVDEEGEVLDVFCKLDMISLAAQGLYHDVTMTMEVALAYRFTPLFEDDENQAATLDKSPLSDADATKSLPQTKDYAPTSITAHLNDYSQRKKSEFSPRTSTGQSSALRGHAVVRPKQANRATQPAKEESRPAVQPHCFSGEMPSDKVQQQQRVRHVSLSNPLVKCRLTDKLHQVIDLLVTTDANLLVVVGQNSNHVIGVVTVADVLSFIVSPPGHGDEQDSPTRVHRRSRRRVSSLSAPSSSLPSVQDEPETSSPLDDVSAGYTWPANGPTERNRYPSKRSSSSDASSANDSGYSSASKLNKDSGSMIDEVKANGGENFKSNFGALRRGVEIERA